MVVMIILQFHKHMRIDGHLETTRTELGMSIEEFFSMLPTQLKFNKSESFCFKTGRLIFLFTVKKYYRYTECNDHDKDHEGMNVEEEESEEETEAEIHRRETR
ncbi:hypothetical protein M9H77_17628 [Catharanthus roseus]|uniref:Uncharacterized protein n=1 Tax=Catharanthus roseus TaxID=4058 RepID=A0ACC0B536_CATRO|nr:hypothetical protein M9H77_17628 [Catharanthus roseus]